MRIVSREREGSFRGLIRSSRSPSFNLFFIAALRFPWRDQAGLINHTRNAGSWGRVYTTQRIMINAGTGQNWRTGSFCWGNTEICQSSYPCPTPLNHGHYTFNQVKTGGPRQDCTFDSRPLQVYSHSFSKASCSCTLFPIGVSLFLLKTLLFPVRHCVFMVCSFSVELGLSFLDWERRRRQGL